MCKNIFEGNCAWLEKASERAATLGYEEGTYIVQVFVTGAIEANVEDHKSAWPNNSMVFSNCAIEKLFEPFGSGIIAELVKLKSRDKAAKKA